jgi:protein-tyrosine phosphatase
MGVRGFVDIHFHLVWGVDDGPADAAVSRRMTQLALEAGTAAIIATPHCSARYRFDPHLAARRLAALEEVADDPALFGGCEIEITDETLRALKTDPRRYTLAGGRYALVELPHRFPHDRLLLVLDQLRELGLAPILAHPERYPVMWERPRLARQWVDRGGLLQITAAALVGRYGRRSGSLAVELLDAGLAHFVASDAHDPSQRPSGLREAFRAVYERLGQAAAARLFTYHPLAVLHDEPL